MTCSKYAMITPHAIPALDSQPWAGSSDPKAILLECLLIAGTALFWFFALPVAAVALMAVKIWETLVALISGKMVRPNPLILRRRPATTAFIRRRSVPVAHT